MSKRSFKGLKSWLVRFGYDGPTSDINEIKNTLQAKVNHCRSEINRHKSEWKFGDYWRGDHIEDLEYIGANHELMLLVVMQWENTRELPKVPKWQAQASDLRKELLKKSNYQSVFPTGI